MNLSSKNPLFISYIRTFIFGVEDSLVSTVGLLSGIAFAGLDRQSIILTGSVLLFVEGLSMGVGSFLSEHAAKEFAAAHDLPLKSTVREGTIMFVSYFIAGFIPLGPYILIQPETAFWLSIVLSLIALFALGAFAAKVFKVTIFRQGMRMLLIGGLAVLVGILVGGLVEKI